MSMMVETAASKAPSDDLEPPSCDDLGLLGGGLCDDEPRFWLLPLPLDAAAAAADDDAPVRRPYWNEEGFGGPRLPCELAGIEGLLGGLYELSRESSL